MAKMHAGAPRYVLYSRDGSATAGSLLPKALRSPWNLFSSLAVLIRKASGNQSSHSGCLPLNTLISAWAHSRHSTIPGVESVSARNVMVHVHVHDQAATTRGSLTAALE